MWTVDTKERMEFGIYIDTLHCLCVLEPDHVFVLHSERSNIDTYKLTKYNLQSRLGVSSVKVQDNPNGITAATLIEKWCIALSYHTTHGGWW